MSKTSMKPIRILIADDHSLMRVGLNALFSHQKDMAVVGEACDGVEAVKLADELNPDVVVMDLMMPKLDGAEATRRILDVSPDAKIFILTSYGTSDDLVRAVQNGARGAMIKSAPIEEIVDSVRIVHAGGEIHRRDAGLRQALQHRPLHRQLHLQQHSRQSYQAA